MRGTTSIEGRTMAIIRIIKSVFSIAFWRTAALFRRNRKIEGASTERLRTFFSDPVNFRDKSIDELVQELGIWQGYDDWDWGRFFYTWRRRGFCVTVATQGSSIRYVVFANPRDEYGSEDMIWERPESNEADQE
jgi:hypothetical protein